MDTNKHELATGRTASSRTLLNRRVFWGAALLMAILIGICFYGVQLREPVYGGKPLSYWLDQIENDPRHADDAVLAVQAIGTNAIPWLLAELETGGSLWRYRANKLLDKQGLFKFRFSNQRERRDRAIWGFFALGPKGRTAIPPLVEQIQSKQLPSAELYALAFTGSEAIPFLITVLTNETLTYAPASAALAVATGVQSDRISGPDVQVFVPVLTRMLQSTNPRTRAKAETALDEIQRKDVAGQRRNLE